MKKKSKHKIIAIVSFLSLWTLTQVNAQSNIELINSHLASEREKNGWTKNDISNYIITDEYTDRQTGLTYAYVQQSHHHIGVYNAISVFVINGNKIAYFKPYLISNLDSKIKTEKPAVTPEEAVTYALLNLGYSNITPLKLIDELQDKSTFIYESAALSARPIKVQLIYRALDENIFLAWDVSIEMKNEAHWWNVRIDALTGNYLDKNDWTVSCGFDHASPMGTGNFDSPALQLPPLPAPAPLGEYNVFAFPTEAPSFGGSTLLINPEDLGVSPYGWHDDNGIAGNEYSTTRGNNVYAYEDINNDNLPGYSPNSSTLQFNYPIDLTQAPLVNQNAAITNLFYDCNKIHDVLYHAGFTAAAGNFQANNYGNGGAGNDYVLAEAFDGGGTNNANFSTPADGSSGRMQMYIWTAPNPDRDGSFDNGIVAHEYGHGLSNRLTGGPSQSSCLSNAEQGGEGWSDWLALMMTTKVADTIAGGMLIQARGIGTYALNQATNGQGIRRYRYSVNMAINPQTYADLATSGTGPHAKGEIWCDAIWDMSSFLINDLGFNSDPTVASAGNNIAMRLVLEGMKLQPCNPGFLDARDAILTAEAILYGNVHRCRIWEAFARRGMGYNAVQGSSNNSTDQTASFAMPPFCLPATQPPVASFSSNLNTIPCAGTIQFTDASINAFDMLWDFGDGSTSILKNPKHEFTSPGIYTIKLKVSNPLGSDSITHPITVNPLFTANVTASPNPVNCGASVQLNAVGTGSSTITYILNSIPFAPLSGTPIAGPTDDDVLSSAIPIGFNFPFYGAIKTQLYISTNGFISFNANSGSGCCAGAILPNNNAALSNLIAVCWTDLFVGAPNSVDYFKLTSPNRFVIRWNDVAHCCATTPAQVTAQIILYETGVIEMHNTSIISSVDVMTQGIENANGKLATVVPGRNGVGFVATNDAFRFTPNVNYTYSWLPGNLTGAVQTVNPLVSTTFTVHVADGSGCVQPFTTALVNVTPLNLTITGDPTFCDGASATLDAGNFESYNWSTGGSTQTISINLPETFTVTVTNENGCTGSAQVTTSINTIALPAINGTTTFCEGGSTDLDAGAGYTTYSWSTGATTQLITASMAETFTVTVTNASGCSASSVIATTIKSLPSVIISGSTEFCFGSASTLVSTDGHSNYIWSTGESTSSISVFTTGTYTVTVTDDIGCTSSSSLSVFVVPNPTPVIVGQSLPCSGSGAILDAGLHDSYVWSDGATTQTTLASAVGNFTVSVTNLNGCTASTSYLVTITGNAPAKPLEMTGSFFSNCLQFNKVYNCTPVAKATSYFWTFPAGVKIISGQGTTSITVNYTSTYISSNGMITVAAVNTCGMSAPLKHKTSSRFEVPVITGDAVMCPGDIKTYSVTPQVGALKYSWSKVFGSSILSGQNTSSIAIQWGAAGGSIKCNVSNSCGSSGSGYFQVALDCPKLAGVDFDFSDLNLYPNPASTSATLQFDAFNEGLGLLAIHNLVGQQVLHKPLHVLSGDNQLVLDLKTYPKGIYTIRLEYNGMARYEKLVVQ